MTLLRSVRAVVLCAVFVARPSAAGEPGGPPQAPPVPAPAAADPRAQRWVTPAVHAKNVSFHTFLSPAAGAEVSYHLYTPGLYARAPDRRCPVVYWLHGSGGGLPGIPRLAGQFDAAIESGRAPPFLVVFVNGLTDGMYVDWKDGSTPLEMVIVRDLVGHIDGTLRTIATRKGRMLEGFSMGGYGAARLGFKHPDLFGAVSMLGAGPLQPDFDRAPRAGPRQREEIFRRVYGGDMEFFRAVSPWRLAEQNAEKVTGSVLIRMAVGDRDETFAVNREFHERLESLKIPHQWRVIPGVGHDTLAVLDGLGDDRWAFYSAAFGPPPPPAAARGEEREFVLTLRVGDRDRRAIVVNAPRPGESIRPAVLALHGGMGSANQMRSNSGFDGLARAEGFCVVYPEGTDFGEGRHAWNTGHLLRRQVQEADDIAYLDALIDTLIRDHGADPARICMTGGSNGGMMTLVYGVARAERLAAIAPVVAAMFTFDRRPAAPLPILLINGARDNEVPIEGGMSRNPLVSRAQSTPYQPLKDTVSFWVGVNGSKPDPLVSVSGTVTTTTFDAGPGGAATVSIVDSEGGHGWPGARARRGVNRPIATFNGADRVWEFFKDARRARPATSPAHGG
ncbi:MAG: prolyl oligopeptidase family serine peptidase [Phycisphaerales bacterium]|nr:prolyl oligopeptidase family serine peptidase [Phycisphaerales bacterium]